MTKALLASVAIAAFALAGCAKDEKMMKDADAPAAQETMSKDAMEKEAMEKEAMEKEAMASESSGGDAMMDLCLSKGGSISEWPGEGGATKTCRAGDGSEYPLASLSSYEAFQ